MTLTQIMEVIKKCFCKEKPKETTSLKQIAEAIWCLPPKKEEKKKMVTLKQIGEAIQRHFPNKEVKKKTYLFQELG